MISFPTSYTSILSRIESVDVIAYSKTRNYINGQVSYLSPYISRGVISLPFLKNKILERFGLEEAKPFIYELCWREYFQRIWFAHSEKTFTDFFLPQNPVLHHQLPYALVHASTGIDVIDEHLRVLKTHGYMHNHVRMYTASITTNVAQAHWLAPSLWMYYHLLDGDLASNMLSWQWVAGTFSSKKYFCNQENINRFCNGNQRDTFLDVAYELLPALPLPEKLKPTLPFSLTTNLPQTIEPSVDPTKPLLLYNHYNLDPHWHQHEDANRILLLEPSHFKKFPVSDVVMKFILSLSKEIPSLQVMVGEVSAIPKLNEVPHVISKEHPAFRHYPGLKEPVPWMFPEVIPTKSFTAFWKACEKSLYKSLTV